LTVKVYVFMTNSIYVTNYAITIIKLVLRARKKVLSTNADNNIRHGVN
jgi:hypothetical protein